MGELYLSGERQVKKNVEKHPEGEETGTGSKE
jgi:hypothetical protein